MIDYLFNYWLLLLSGIPLWLLMAEMCTFLVGMVMSISLLGYKKGVICSIRILMIEYSFLLYSSTVFFRISPRVLKYNLKPFWSYLAFFDGSEPNILYENFSNVFVFMPFGLLAGFAFKHITIRHVVLLGICLSVGIETLQFFLNRGFSEIDDVMHNTLGCIIGYVLYLLFIKVWKYSMNYCKLR